MNKNKFNLKNNFAKPVQKARQIAAYMPKYTKLKTQKTFADFVRFKAYCTLSCKPHK
jgi:hypothetical protein